MKYFILLVALLFATPAIGQQPSRFKVVVENGDSVVYAPVKARVVHIHDTCFVYVHDTVSHNESRESSTVTRIDTGRITLNVYVQRAVERQRLVDRTAFGVYGYGDFRGSLLAPAFWLDLGTIRLWVYTGAYYRVDNHFTYFTAGIAGFLPVW